MIKKNEKGYALLTVLLTMTIFMLLAFSFMGQAASSVKQNNVTETKSQSVALAEMGVTYFQHAVQNVYETNYNAIVNQVKSEREDDLKKGKVKPNDDYIQSAIGKMQKKLRDDLNPETKSIDTKSGAKFDIQYNKFADIKSAGNILKFRFNIIGSEQGKTTTIGTAIEIDFSNLLIEGESSGSGSANGKIPTGNDIADPGNLKACRNGQSDFEKVSCQINGSADFPQNTKLNFDNSIFKVSGALRFGNLNNEDTNNSLLYILGSLTTGNMNSLVNTNIHVNGAADFGHFNGRGLIDSVIEILGNAKIENIKLIRSSIYVGNYGAGFGQINEMTDSVIFVNSDATIKGLNIGSNSIVCVNGHLDINNINSNSNGKVYAKTSNNNNNVITGDAAFKDGGACSRSGSSVSWGNPSISADYDYQY